MMMLFWDFVSPLISALFQSCSQFRVILAISGTENLYFIKFNSTAKMLDWLLSSNFITYFFLYKILVTKSFQPLACETKISTENQ